LVQSILYGVSSHDLQMVNSGAKGAAEAARLFGFHQSTISRLLAVERLNAE
jgi:hypothetical protein